MVQPLQTYALLLHTLIVAMVAYDAWNHRDWLHGMSMVLLVVPSIFLPVIGPVLYMVIVHRMEQDLVECPQCGKQMHSSLDQCPACGFDPTAARETKQAEEEPRVCGECGTEFETDRGLMEHRGKVHGEPTESRTKGHVCDECGRSFDSERGLHIHQSVIHE